MIDLSIINRIEMECKDETWYRLILTDIEGRQFIFNGVASGYAGEGPMGTVQILVDLGMSEDVKDFVYNVHGFVLTRD